LRSRLFEDNVIICPLIPVGIVQSCTWGIGGDGGTPSDPGVAASFDVYTKPIKLAMPKWFFD
jgi:hypothetical protein